MSEYLKEVKNKDLNSVTMEEQDVIEKIKDIRDKNIKQTDNGIYSKGEESIYADIIQKFLDENPDLLEELAQESDSE